MSSTHTKNEKNFGLKAKIFSSGDIVQFNADFENASSPVPRAAIFIQWQSTQRTDWLNSTQHTQRNVSDKVKIKGAIHLKGHRLGAHIPVYSVETVSGSIDHWVHDAWPVRRQTYGCTPFTRSSWLDELLYVSWTSQLDVCSTFAHCLLYAFSMFARCLLDDRFVWGMLYACFIFAQRLVDRVNEVLSSQPQSIPALWSVPNYTA